MPRWITDLVSMPVSAIIPTDDLPLIADAISRNEALHNGQICFAIERSLGLGNVISGMTARDRATQVFSQLGVWDTARNNGVLLYLLTSQHRIELIADRGFDGIVSDDEWRAVCLELEERLHGGNATDGVVAAIERISGLIAAHYPRLAGDDVSNELPDLPYVL